MPGLRGIVTVFSVTFLASFAVERPIRIEWAGIAIENEWWIWICLTIALLYVVTLAWLRGLFEEPKPNLGAWSREAEKHPRGEKGAAQGQRISKHLGQAFFVATFLLLAWNYYRLVHSG